MKLCFILGTRPEIIKLSPLIRICVDRKIDFFIVHTGQHYSPNMDEIFFKEIELPHSKYNLHAAAPDLSKLMANIQSKLVPILKKEKPNFVLVQGDTSTVLAGALAAARLGLKLGHVEAGLRSGDFRMVEEYNRIMADNLADFLFAPTTLAEANLLSEKMQRKKIFLTGNTIVDALHSIILIAKKKSKILNKLNLKEKNYALITLHRAENVDIKDNIKSIIAGLDMICSKHRGLKFVFPMHPRTRKKIEEFRLKLHKNIEIIEPLGYIDFVILESNAKIILTDSGGVQEEAATLGIPSLTLRISTERPETVKAGINIVTGYNPKNIFSAFEIMIKKKVAPTNIFGDGNSADKIIKILKKSLKK